MKKELENLSKIHLDKVAEKYNIFHPERMSKEDLINKILSVTGHEVVIKKQPDVKVKKTWGTILYHTMFVCLILISVLTTIYNLVNRLYFQPKMSGSSLESNEVYGIFLTLASAAFSFYIYYRWMKTGFIHVYMLFSIIMSIGWFIYIAYGHYRGIVGPYSKWVSLGFKKDAVTSAFVGFYWFNVAALSTLTVTTITCYLIRR